jgi:hypothetical protein
MNSSSRIQKVLIGVGLIVLCILLEACQAAKPSPNAAPAVNPTTEAAVPEATGTPSIAPGWKEYTNASFGIHITYPQDWKGPEVYATEDQIILEIGSAVAFSYGTSLEDRVYPEGTFYIIDVLYYKNNSRLTLEQLQGNHGPNAWSYRWCDYDIYQALINLGNGESLIVDKEAVSKVRNVTLGQFQGIEYVATLPKDAQSMGMYERQTTLIDGNYDLIEVIGNPFPSQDVPNMNTNDVLRGVDEAFLDIYRGVVESISLD